MLYQNIQKHCSSKFLSTKSIYSLIFKSMQIFLMKKGMSILLKITAVFYKYWYSMQLMLLIMIMLLIKKYANLTFRVQCTFIIASAYLYFQFFKCNIL